MKRHQITLIVCGVLLAAVCAATGWFLFTAVAAKNIAAEERNQAYEDLQKIYHAKVFPSTNNIARLNADQQALETWLTTASNLVHKGDLHVAKLSPSSFKDALTETVRRLSAQPGSFQGKVVVPGFCFGFDQYLGQSDSLPSSEHLDRLTVQLTIIEKICAELYAANILELKTVAREVFDSAKAGDGNQEEESDSRRRCRRDERPDAVRQTAAAPSAGSQYASSQRFTFAFQARPAAFIEALNRLAKMELFTVVAEVEVVKAGDSLAAYKAKKSSAASGTQDGVKAVEVDLATVPHVERIVTDPERDPPVNVKPDIDVYSFEGV